MPLAPTRVYLGQGIMPHYGSAQALNVGISLAAGQSFLQGTVMGFVPNTNSGVAVNDVQTITITGSPTGGTFTITVLGQFVTVAYNITPANLQLALLALTNIGPVTPPGFVLPPGSTTIGPPNVTVTGTAGSSYVITFQNQMGALFQPLMGVAAAFTGGSSPAIAIVHTTLGQPVNGYYKAYLSTNSDGSQIPTCILQYQATTDGYGRVVWGDTFNIGMDGTSGFEWQTPAWFKGQFDVSLLTGLDANSVTPSVSGWRIIAGPPSAPFTQATQLVYIG